MENGYKIFWTDFALSELEKTIEYLQENWTEKELRNLAVKLDEILTILSQNPNLFQVSNVKDKIRRVVVLTNNTLYYKVINNRIEILFFFKSSKSHQKKIEIIFML